MSDKTQTPHDITLAARLKEAATPAQKEAVLKTFEAIGGGAAEAAERIRATMPQQSATSSPDTKAVAAPGTK